MTSLATTSVHHITQSQAAIVPKKVKGQKNMEWLKDSGQIGAKVMLPPGFLGC